MQLRGLVCQLDAVGMTLDWLQTQIATAFHAHPGAQIISSVPGLGVALGARLVAEIGDGHNRFTDARALTARPQGEEQPGGRGRLYVWAVAASRHNPLWEARYGRGGAGLTDRIEALGGGLSVHSPPCVGTALEVVLPLTAPRGPELPAPVSGR